MPWAPEKWGGQRRRGRLRSFRASGLPAKTADVHRTALSHWSGGRAGCFEITDHVSGVRRASEDLVSDVGLCFSVALTRSLVVVVTGCGAENRWLWHQGGDKRLVAESLARGGELRKNVPAGASNDEREGQAAPGEVQMLKPPSDTSSSRCQWVGLPSIGDDLKSGCVLGRRGCAQPP